MCISQSFWSNCFQRVKQGWSRRWRPTPVFLPGESHGQRSLAGYSPCGHREPDTAERLTATTKQGDVNRYTSALTLWTRRGGRTELQILENLEKLLSPKSPTVFSPVEYALIPPVIVKPVYLCSVLSGWSSCHYCYYYFTLERTCCLHPPV